MTHRKSPIAYLIFLPNNLSDSCRLNTIGFNLHAAQVSFIQSKQVWHDFAVPSYSALNASLSIVGLITELRSNRKPE